MDEAAKEIKDEEKATAEEAAEKEAQRQAAIAAAQQSGAGANPGNNGPGAMLPAAPAEAAYFDLNFLKVDQIGPQLMTLLNPTGRISVFPKDNRLLVVDTADRLKLVAQAIEQLDIPRPQVRIDALIYDASLEDVRRCGVNWNQATLKGNNLGPTGLAQDSVALQALTATSPAAAAANGALTFTSLGSNFDLSAVINALSQSKDSRLLSDPSVIVYDQETASFEAVTEIPFQQLTQGLGGGSIGTTAFREAGTTLTVTPQISRDQTITMLVNPRFSILAGLTPQTNQPIIDRREARTTIRVQNGGTIVIGGLRQRSAIKNMTKIPYLGDMKYIYPLFRDKQPTVRESELIVFITPTVIDMGYVGEPRQKGIHDAALPELDTIPYPKLPSYPCPPDQWPHRCGLCNKCNKFHCGACNGKKGDPYGPMTNEYGPVPGDDQLPATSQPTVEESAPVQSPAQVAPPVQVAPSAEATSQQSPSTRPVATAARVSPFKTPVPSTSRAAAIGRSADEATASSTSDSLPPLMTPTTLLYVPLERVSEIPAAIRRLPPTTDSESAPDQSLPASPPAVKVNIGQIRRLPPAENDATGNVANPQPQPTAKSNGPKRLSPARPIHVAERPMGAGVR